MFLRFTLAESLSQRIEWSVYSGLIFGGVAFVLLVWPVQCIVLVLLRWCRILPIWKAVCSQLPACALLFYLVRASLTALTPEGERNWFELATGVDWPTEAKLVLAQHGLGMQDRRNLWLLEGQPADFYRLVKARGWTLKEDDLFPMATQGIQRASEHFRKSAPWQPAAIYFWEGDKGADFGMSCLLTDAERKRWAVWVMD